MANTGGKYEGRGPMSDFDYDVIVCGVGTAGQTAATFAAKRGARVLAIDIADEIGGNTARSTGQMSAAGTRLQAERGIHDTPDMHYDDVMRISHGTADPQVVRAAVDNAADTMEWLLDNGLDLLPEMPVIFKGHEPYQVARTYWGPDRGGKPLQKVLGTQFMNAVENHGVTLMLETEVVDLVQGEDGRVSGVAVKGKDGTEQTHSAPNVLLSMGGYASNEALFPKYSNGYPLFKGGAGFASHPHANGRGHELGEKAGGYIRYQDFFMPTFGRVKDPKDPSFVSGVTRIIATSLQEPRPLWEIFVNWDGERFVAEDSESPDAKELALLTIPDLTFWAVFDQRAREESECFYVDMTHEDADALYNTHESFRKADSLEELAEGMGVDAAGLAETVERYNKFVEQGKDDDFGRGYLPAPIGKPPYYGVKHHGLSITSFAGLAVDENFQLIREDGKAIPGLYAAGETLGLGSTSGRSFCGGMALMPAMSFGRLLGDQIWQW